jgi:hypothetical protein
MRCITLPQGCSHLLRDRNDGCRTAHRVSALLQSVYPPLSLVQVQNLLARACREVGCVCYWRVIGGKMCVWRVLAVLI